MTARAPRPLVVRDGLAVYREGAGRPVLLMPGPHRFQIPGDGSAGPLIEGLVRIGHQVISFDPPGSGRSTRPSRLSMEEMHACADESLAVAGIPDPIAVMGHSMGGLVALAYALDHPERIERLVLVGTGTGGRAYMGAPGALWNASHPGFPGLAALGILSQLWRTRGPETVLNNYISARSYVERSLAPRMPVRAADWFAPRRGRQDWHRIARRLDYGPRIGEIAVPTLVLCGRKDPQYAPACSEELAAGISGSRIVWFDRSGHSPFVEEQDAFWSEIARFLDDD